MVEKASLRKFDQLLECPNCEVELQLDTPVPEWECPSCGTVVKGPDEDWASNRNEAASGEGGE